MNPISMLTGAITHPVRTAGSITQHAYGVAATGVRTTLRLIDWAAGQGREDARPGWAGESRRPTAAPPAPAATSAAPDEASAAAAPVTTAAGPAPAKKAPARKAPAKKAAATKAPAKKAPAKKVAAKKAPSARAATLAPALAPEEIEALEDDSPRTPSGIPAADVGHNPDTTDTDLHQPGTPPVMDPGTVKAVLSESETLRRAADPDKG